MGDGSRGKRRRWENGERRQETRGNSKEIGDGNK